MGFYLYMKITKSSNIKFNPITIEIVIESQEELTALLDLVGWDISIPDKVDPNRGESFYIIQDLFKRVYKELQ